MDTKSEEFQALWGEVGTNGQWIDFESLSSKIPTFTYKPTSEPREHFKVTVMGWQILRQKMLFYRKIEQYINFYFQLQDFYTFVSTSYRKLFKILRILLTASFFKDNKASR